MNSANFAAMIVMSVLYASFAAVSIVLLIHDAPLYAAIVMCSVLLMKWNMDGDDNE